MGWINDQFRDIYSFMLKLIAAILLVALLVVGALLLLGFDVHFAW